MAQSYAIWALKTGTIFDNVKGNCRVLGTHWVRVLYTAPALQHAKWQMIPRVSSALSFPGCSSVAVVSCRREESFGAATERDKTSCSNMQKIYGSFRCQLRITARKYRISSNALIIEILHNCWCKTVAMVAAWRHCHHHSISKYERQNFTSFNDVQFMICAVYSVIVSDASSISYLIGFGLFSRVYFICVSRYPANRLSPTLSLDNSVTFSNTVQLSCLVCTYSISSCCASVLRHFFTARRCAKCSTAHLPATPFHHSLGTKFPHLNFWH